MTSIRLRVCRLELRTTALRAPACAAVRVYIPDNHRGGPGPGTYGCGPAALTIYAPDDNGTICPSSLSGSG
jgi:hypothetical protein